MTDVRTETIPSYEPTGEVIIEASHVTKHFTTPGGHPLPVLDDISLQLHAGEIVALLGKSGSGKSTLLRCIAGLIATTTGVISCRGTPINGANPGVAMVFQTFALLPWLTVQANTEMGLEARGMPPAERHRRAAAMIDLIGLDGFEQAYPKELSGGMRQRVGFARALVVEPDALLMDEPFSALDVLTAENLRNELLNLWRGKDFPTRAILIVTHNIEEAVQMADRIFVLSSNPGKFKAEIHCDLARPRNRRGPEFEALVDQIYGIMTEQVTPDTGHQTTVVEPGLESPTDLPLPHASIGELAGLLEILDKRGGRDDLPKLAQHLTFEVDDLLPLVDAAEMLGFATVADADIKLTPAGKALAEASILTSKELFATAARERAPLVRAIVRALETTHDLTLDQAFFLDFLRRGFSEEQARAQFDTAVEWGRYGELFDYAADHRRLILTPPADEAGG